MNAATTTAIDTAMMTTEAAWDTLLDMGVSEQTLQIVTSINGYTLQTLEDVLYAHTGFHSFEQL